MATKPMQNIPEKSYIRVCDLFACSGGLSHGLNEVEGIEVLVANEYDKNCWETYKYNHPNCNLIEGDITDKDIKDQIVNSCLENKINVIVGGIPCVAFSMSGKRDIFDDRGQLYLDYFEIVKRVNPKICLIENVKGLDSMKHLDIQNLGEDIIKKMKMDYKKKMKRDKFEEKYNQEFFFVKEKWKEMFEKLGYICEYKILKASNYGVPQHRERIIFIASKINNEIIWPEETHNEKGNEGKKKWVSVKESIEDLKTHNEDKDFSHETRKYKDKKTINALKKQKIETSYGRYTEANYKCHPDKPSNTVKENHGAVFVHYDLPRHMTARELARLQSFPDNFLFKCTKGQAYKHIGNAVPPLLGKVLGNSIKQMFDNQKDQKEEKELIIVDEDEKDKIQRRETLIAKEILYELNDAMNKMEINQNIKIALNFNFNFKIEK